MRVHLVDGTYELFRQFFGRPPHLDASGMEVAAVRGVLGSLLSTLENGATHVGVATDHVIESRRNQMWPGYKTSAGVDPVLLAQFELLEDAIATMGVVVWPMTEWEADDALASAAAVSREAPGVEQVRILTPDKDLAQCVIGGRVVQVDRRRRPDGDQPPGDPEGVVTDEQGVWNRYGVGPESIPDYLALVGDSADGFPGIKGWGAKSAASVLSRYGHLEAIPKAPGQWETTVRGAAALAATLAADMELALLFRDLATLRVDRALLADVGDLCWTAPAEGFGDLCRRLGAPGLVDRAEALATLRS